MMGTPDDQPRAARAREWWRRFFASPDSLVLGRFPDDGTSRWEAESTARLMGLREGMAVADIPCGPGRHLPWWAACGCSVVGLDASPLMLALAAKAIARAPGPPQLVQGLMQALPFRDESFDVVLNLFNSFGYLPTDAENETVLAEVARCLRPGGALLLDTRNPVLEILFAPYREDMILPNGREVRASAKYDLATKRLTVRWRDLDERATVYEASIRLYNVEELTEMMTRAGLKVEAVYGDISGTPFEPDHAQVLVLARRG